MKNMRRYDDLADRDKKHHLHPQTSITELLDHGPRIVESGHGVSVTDAKGHELLDGLAGTRATGAWNWRRR